MSKLMLIQKTAQNVAEAITAALRVETEIVDDNLMVVAGTGTSRKKIGQIMEFGLKDGDFLYARILRVRGSCSGRKSSTGSHLRPLFPGRYHRGGR